MTVAFALAALIACGSVFSYLHLLTKRAQFIVGTTNELSEGKQIPTVADIRQHFGGRLHLDECVGSECSYTVTLSNRVLAALHIVPHTELQSYFWTRDGVVLENMLNYTTTVNRRYRIVTQVQVDFCKGCGYLAIHTWGAASSLDTNGLVQIGNESPARSLRTVLSLNTDCFRKHDGCQSVADLLPTVWEQTAEMKVACIVQNDRGFVQKPANWP